MQRLFGSRERGSLEAKREGLTQVELAIIARLEKTLKEEIYTDKTLIDIIKDESRKAEENKKPIMFLSQILSAEENTPFLHKICCKAKNPEEESLQIAMLKLVLSWAPLEKINQRNGKGDPSFVLICEALNKKLIEVFLMEDYKSRVNYRITVSREVHGIKLELTGAYFLPEKTPEFEDVINKINAAQRNNTCRTGGTMNTSRRSIDTPATSVPVMKPSG